jgi:hypothetical protein
MEFKPLVAFGILNGASIGLLNLSLGFNSVGFYQVCHVSSSHSSLLATCSNQLFESMHIIFLFPLMRSLSLLFGSSKLRRVLSGMPGVLLPFVRVGNVCFVVVDQIKGSCWTSALDPSRGILSGMTCVLLLSLRLGLFLTLRIHSRRQLSGSLSGVLSDVTGASVLLCWFWERCC